MQEYVATSFICGDEAKASFRDPTVNFSILEATGGDLERTILVAVLVGKGSAYWREKVWALDWNRGGRFAKPFARNDWTRKWADYGSRQARSFRSIFDRRQREGRWGDRRRGREGTG